MKRIAIVTGHFPPSNLAGVHRSRLWAQYLPEFGWEPIIVTAHWEHYEEKLDTTLLELVSPELRVIRTNAISTKHIRLLGDIGLRAFYWQLKALDDLIARREIDFLHITIPSNYSALLGELLYRRHRFPFGVDYQDPWVQPWPGVEKPLSKAWISYHLSKLLEPWALKNVALITGVAPLHYQAVLERNPHLREHCVTASMPIGNSEADYRAPKPTLQENMLFPSNDGLFHMVYAGTMWPKAQRVLDRFLEALAVLRSSDPGAMERLRVHFIGTGKSASEPEGQISPAVQRLGLARWVDEFPRRIGYVDVLNHLNHASAILIIGSTEAHYTPSKIYQSVQAKRPIFALLHEDSTAVRVIHETGAGRAVTFRAGQLLNARELAAALAAFIRNPRYSAESVQWGAFEAYSARNSARVLVGAVNSALELSMRRSKDTAA